MGLKDDIANAASSIKHAAEHAGKDLHDAVKEEWHKGEADAEHAKRDAAGDAMTPGEYAGSMLNEAGSNAQAGIDRAKRDLRDAAD